MNTHKRQGSSSSFSVDLNGQNVRLSSLENFMFITKLMQDDILVPTKLKDKKFGKKKFILEYFKPVNAKVNLFK